MHQNLKVTFYEILTAQQLEQFSVQQGCEILCNTNYHVFQKDKILILFSFFFSF